MTVEANPSDSARSLLGRYPLGWACVSSAALATAVDAALLQKGKSYFTGGFLAPDSAVRVADMIGFFIASFGADMAVASPLVLAAAWVWRACGVRLAWTYALAAASGAVPLVVADIVSYQLLDYLGDAFDVGLMFDLARRSPGEVLAVVADHLPAALAVVGGGGAIVAAVLVYANTRTVVSDVPGPVVRRSHVWVTAAGIALVCVGVSWARAADAVLDNGLRRKPSVQVLGRVVGRLTDVDRDGFGWIGPLRDPDPWNPKVYPFAIDWPGNGIDEDGLAGDLPTGEAYVEASGAAPTFLTRPTVVLFVLESFRADAAGATVEGRPVTPRLDRLAADGVRVASAFSHNGYTIQSRFHIMAGSLANLRDGTTLIDDFKANGYEVAYFSAQDESFLEPGYDVGFARADVHYDARQDTARRYTRFTTAGSLAVPASVLVERVGQFLAARRGDRPLFLYVNFHDTHFPYHHRMLDSLLPVVPITPDAIGPANRAQLRATYLNTAANVDRAIGDTLERVESAVGAAPAVLVLGDHGESLYDEGFLGHGYALNDAQTQIPLIANGLPIRLPSPFGQADLRDALRRALAEPASQAGPSIVERSDGAGVLQYLGMIGSPRELGTVTASGRVTFDLRTNTARFPGQETAVPLDALTPEQRDVVVELIQRWERIRVARATRGVD